MKSSPRIGSTGQLTFTAESAHAIDFADHGMPAVLSTPWLIWFLEHAAREAVLPLLDDGESTVGVHVDVQHLAATPIGDTVDCRARVIAVDRRLISFQLEASDTCNLIAKGFHKLQVINVARFAAGLETRR